MGYRSHDGVAVRPSVPVGARRRWRPLVPAGARRWWRPVVLAVAVPLAAFELRGHLPSPAETWAVLREVRTDWLLVAVLLAVVSMAAFAEQQRLLLGAFGVRMPAPSTLAVSYARSAMSTSLPGGSAISAGYAFQRYRAYGATHPIAAAVTLLSGLASFAGICLLYAGAMLSWTKLPGPALAIIAAVLAVAILAWRVRRSATPTPAAAMEIHSSRADRSATPTPLVAVEILASRVDRSAAPVDDEDLSRWGRLRHTIRETATLAAVVPGRRWLTVTAAAVLNWLTDLACLLACVHAMGLTVSARAVATAYLLAQLARQIPVTPGGIGVIEAGLILALTTAGAAAAPAAAAVLLYRLLSCWLILPVGLACWTAMRGAVASPGKLALAGQ